MTIARALVNDPAIVWADEPTGDLDSEGADDIVALMRRLNLERGLSFLIVTHDASVGERADRIVRMRRRPRDRRRDGRAAAGPPRRSSLARMTELFGLPIGTVAVALTIALCAALGLVGALALRRPVLLRLGLRNATRRRGRSALIVVGLMLGTTIITAALVTGDTMSHTIRSMAVDVLGQTDEVVTARGTKRRRDAARARDRERLPRRGRRRRRGVRAAGLRARRRHHAGDHRARRGAGAVAAGAPSRGSRCSPTDPARMSGFGEIRGDRRASRSPSTTSASGEVYLDAEAADALGRRRRATRSTCSPARRPPVPRCGCATSCATTGRARRTGRC